MRDGMSGVLNAPRVNASSNNVQAVLTALHADASVGEYRPNWYEVAVAGFNFVDQQCIDYFNELFFLERNREATNRALAAFGQTTDAILVATGAARVTISVVAQAFGLARNVTDIVSDSFLYKLPPATTLGFVRQMQSAYRNGADTNKAQINSPTQAYHAIQSYLELCLPPTIEARLVDHISGARAVAVTSPGSTQVVVGSEISTVDRARSAAGRAPLDAGTPAATPNPPRPRPLESSWTNVSDVVIDRPTGQAIQRALCFRGELVDGIYGAKTEAALKLFKSVEITRGVREEKWMERTVRLTRDEISNLRLLNQCADGALNYVENYILSLSVDTGLSKSISDAIKEKYGITDGNRNFPNLRSNIAEWRRELKLNNGPEGMFEDQITPDLLTRILRGF